MYKNKYAALIVVLLIFPSIIMVSGEKMITVGVDKQVYRPSENVTISGVADADVEVFIKVFDGVKTLFNVNVTAKQDTAQQDLATDQTSRYSVIVSLPDDALLGTYTVTAIIGGKSYKTMFTVTDSTKEVQIATSSLDSSNSEDLTDKMLERAGDMRERVSKTIEDLKEDDIEIPDEAFQYLDLGIEKESEARELFETGNVTTAAQSALSALRLYGDAYRIITKLLPTATRSDTADSDSASTFSGEISTQGLLMAIDRTFSYLDRINETANRLEEEGYSVETEIRLNLLEAHDALTRIKEELESGEVSLIDAAEEYGKIRALLGQTMGLLHRTTLKDHKKAMADRFINYTQSRIQGLNDKVRRLTDEVGNEQVTDVSLALGNVLRDMNGIRERLAVDEVDDVIDDLDRTVDEIDDNIDKLDGGGLSFKVRAINFIEARIRILRATSTRLKGTNLNTTNIDLELEKAEELLEQVMELLEEGDIEAIEELLKAAETHSQNAASDILSSGRRKSSDNTSTLGGLRGTTDTD